MTTAVRVAPLPPADEEHVMKTRWLTQATAPRGEPLFKRLARKFIQVCEEADQGSPDIELAYEALLRDITSQEVQTDKYNAMLLANEREQQRYGIKQQELGNQIKQAQEDIDACKAELEQAKIVRQHNEEYEVLRQVLVQHPTRAATQREIDKVKEAIQKTRQEGLRTAATMQRRRQQFALLFHVIEELQRSIDEPYMDGVEGQGAGEAQQMDVDT